MAVVGWMQESVISHGHYREWEAESCYLGVSKRFAFLELSLLVLKQTLGWGMLLFFLL